jgi:hypothetical protein
MCARIRKPSLLSLIAPGLLGTMVSNITYFPRGDSEYTDPGEILKELNIYENNKIVRGLPNLFGAPLVR